MKKLNVFGASVLTLAMLTLTACGDKPAATTKAPAPSTPPAVTTVAPTPDPAPAESNAPAGDAGDAAAVGDKLVGPYIVTSCGQSPGAVMINMIAVQEGYTSTNNNIMTAEDFQAGDAKTLIVTSGTSGKGMGAAGTDVNAEIERCTALIETAKEAGLTIVGAHIEGMARRTDSADAASIEAIMGLADVMLVIEDSDNDGFFTKYAEDNNKTLHKVKDALSISSVLS